MILLRCPKFLRCLTADAGNFDRGHSLTSLLLPLAALSSLPTSARPITVALLVPVSLRTSDIGHWFAIRLPHPHNFQLSSYHSIPHRSAWWERSASYSAWMSSGLVSGAKLMRITPAAVRLGSPRADTTWLLFPL